MKVALTFLLSTFCAFGGVARLAWDNPNPVGFVGRFNVYHTTNLVSTPFTLFGESATNEFRLPALQSGFHCFIVSAVGTNGFESDPSNQVLAPVANPPAGLKIIIEIQ